MVESVKITYVEADGTEKEVQAEIGKNLMQVAHDNNVELEGNAVLKCGVSITGSCFVNKSFVFFTVF